MFYDVPDQSHQLLTNGDQVFGLVFLIFLQDPIYPYLPCLFRRTTTRRSSSFHTFPLETEHRSVAQVGMDVAVSFLKAVQTVRHKASSNISGRFLTPTTSHISRRCMERTSISRLSRCRLHDFDSLDHVFLLTQTLEDRSFAFTGMFFLKRRW